MVILVSEDSNRYARHLLLIERECFGFNTLESVVVEFKTVKISKATW
jgi:hypothetical protein